MQKDQTTTQKYHLLIFPTLISHFQYNMGKYYNWIQVFGKEKYLWPFPFFTESGKPFGDGVVWPKKADPADEQDQEVEMIDSNGGEGYYQNDQFEGYGQ